MTIIAQQLQYWSWIEYVVFIEYNFILTADYACEHKHISSHEKLTLD